MRKRTLLTGKCPLFVPRWRHLGVPVGHLGAQVGNLGARVRQHSAFVTPALVHFGSFWRSGCLCWRYFASRALVFLDLVPKLVILACKLAHLGALAAQVGLLSASLGGHRHILASKLAHVSALGTQVASLAPPWEGVGTPYAIICCCRTTYVIS